MPTVNPSGVVANLVPPTDPSSIDQKPTARLLQNGSVQITANLNDVNLGAFVCGSELNPSNADALITVPSGKGFVGRAVLYNSVAAGTLGVSFGTGGTLAEVVGSTPQPIVVPLNVASAGSNAVTAVVSGGGLGFVGIFGHVK